MSSPAPMLPPPSYGATIAANRAARPPTNPGLELPAARPGVPTRVPGTTLDGRRFRTLLCKNLALAEGCPFGARCMYAHVPEELRTIEQNEADGLITEQDVRAFQRALAKRRKKASANARRMLRHAAQQQLMGDAELLSAPNSGYALAGEDGEHSEGTRGRRPSDPELEGSGFMPSAEGPTPDVTPKAGQATQNLQFGAFPVAGSGEQDFTALPRARKSPSEQQQRTSPQPQPVFMIPQQQQQQAQTIMVMGPDGQLQMLQPQQQQPQPQMMQLVPVQMLQGFGQPQPQQQQQQPQFMYVQQPQPQPQPQAVNINGQTFWLMPSQ